MENYRNALKYEDVAAGSDGTAQKKFNDAYLGGVEAHVNTLKAAYESLSMTVLNSDTVNGILGVGSAITGTIDKFIQFAGLVPTLATGLGMFLGGTNQGLFSGLNPFSGKNRNFLLKKDISPLQSMSNWLYTQQDVQGKDVAALKRSPEWVEQFNKLDTAHMRNVANNLGGVKGEMEGIMTIGQKAGSVLKNFGKSLVEGFLMGATVFLVSKGIEAYSNAINASAISIEDLKKKQQEYQQTVVDLTTAQNDQATVQSKLAELAKVEAPSVAEQSQIEELQTQNAKLTRDIILLKQQEVDTKAQAEVAALAAEATATSTSGWAGSDQNYQAGGKKSGFFRDLWYNSPGSDPEILSKEESLTDAIEKHSAAVKERDVLLAKSNRTDAEEARYTELEAQIADYRTNITTLNTEFAAIGTPRMTAAAARGAYELGNFEERVSVFGSVLSDATGDEQQKNLIALANAGNLTQKSLEDMVGADTAKQLYTLTGGIDQTLSLVSILAAESASAATSVTSVGTGLSASFETVKTSVTNLTAQYTALSSAQKQQATDGYLTIDTLNALADAGIEYRDAIEPVDSMIAGQTGTYKVNLDTLSKTVEANNQYEIGLIELKKAAALNEIQTLNNKDATEDLTDAEKEQLATAKERVALYDELAKGLANMSKASAEYKIAIETANASADYDYGTGTIFKTITDGLTSGRIATDEFKAAMSFFTDGQFGDSITQDDIPAIQAFADSIADFTQGGAAGLNAATEKFRTALWSGGKGLLDENGRFKEGVTLADAAAALGENVGTEFTYSLLKSYEDYGFDVNLEQLMRDEDWQMVADTMNEQAKPMLDTFAKLTGLYAQEQTEEVQNQIRNIMNSLSAEDLNQMISDYQAAIDSGKFTGDTLAGLQTGQKAANSLLTEKETYDKEIQLSVEDNASPDLNKIIGLLAGIHSKNIQIGVSFKMGKADPGVTVDDVIPDADTPAVTPNTGAYEYTRPLTAYGYGGASGNANARGTWGRGSGGRTLVGELGPEIVVDPTTNRWYTVGDRGAQFTNLPQNAIVFNHLQTQSILGQGRLGSRGKALAGGNAAFNEFEMDPNGGREKAERYRVIGGIDDIGSRKPPQKYDTPSVAKSNAAEIYKSEIKLLEMQIKLTNDLLNMYEKGTANWFAQQQYIIDNYKRQAVLAQAEYDRLIASGSDIKSEEVQSVLQSLVEYRKEVFESSKDYWEAEKDNANTTLEHMKSQAEAVKDLKESYHDLTKSIQAEQRSIDSELRIASEAYPNLTTSEREAAFSGDDYRQLSNRLAVIAAEAANMQADYMQQIKDVGEESSYELESITDEFKTQYELKLDAYNIAKNELAVLKAKKNLENVQSERSVAMLVGGLWTWVADAENVADAMRNVSDAEQELADAQSDATFNAEQANISGVINQIDDQIGAIDALVYSSDALAEEVHSLVATIQDQVLAAMSPSSSAMLASLPMYAGTSTGAFGTSSLQSLLAASLAGSSAAYAPMSSLGVDLSSILGNMGSVRPSISVSSSPTGDIVSIGQLTITGAVASQFIALLRSVAPLG